MVMQSTREKRRENLAQNVGGQREGLGQRPRKRFLVKRTESNQKRGGISKRAQTGKKPSERAGWIDDKKGKRARKLVSSTICQAKKNKSEEKGQQQENESRAHDASKRARDGSRTNKQSCCSPHTFSPEDLAKVGPKLASATHIRGRPFRTAPANHFPHLSAWGNRSMTVGLVVGPRARPAERARESVHRASWNMGLKKCGAALNTLRRLAPPPPCPNARPASRPCGRLRRLGMLDFGLFMLLFAEPVALGVLFSEVTFGKNRLDREIGERGDRWILFGLMVSG
ncbi:hypothetical protein BKA81DRAFT_395098 [Phyllosticta paracitricarpa]